MASVLALVFKIPNFKADKEAAMALVTYNGISLPYSNITGFQQVAKYDPSNTDRILTQFNINVQCILNSDYLAIIQENNKALHSADIMRTIRSILMKPRQSLSVKVNNTELMPAPSTGNGETASSIDAMNGPLPQYCNIISITEGLFLLDFHVTANYWEYNTPTINSNGSASITNTQIGAVLYNRWSEVVEIDKCNYTKHTRSGEYQIRSDALPGTLADSLRSNMAVLGVPNGFLRNRASYTVDPSGLHLKYQIEDHEVYRLPPKGAFEAEGSFTQSVNKFGITEFGKVFVKLKGSKDIDQSRLIAAAIAVGAAKMFTTGIAGAIPGSTITGAFSTTTFIPMSASVKQSLFTNEVEFMMEAQRRFTKTKRLIITGGFLNMTEPVFSGSNDTLVFQTPAYLDRGSAGLLIQAAAYYDPNIINVLGKAGDTTTKNPTTTLGTSSVPLPKYQQLGTKPGFGGDTPTPGAGSQ